MRIEEDTKYDYDDFLIKPKRSEAPSRNIEIIRNYNFKYSPIAYRGCPIIAANMDTTGTSRMAYAMNELKCSVALHKFNKPEHIIQHLDNNWFTIGIKESDFERLRDLPFKPPMICIDVANGYTKNFVEFVRGIRDYSPESVIMAGNVATAEMTQELIINGGADIIKVGIGPGSACTTRLVTGIGYPQASAVAECADVAHGLRAHICADGGCKTPGDVAKAFGIGADFVMLGGMLAGTEECDGNWQYEYMSGERYFYCGKDSIFTGDPSTNYRTTWPEGFKPASMNPNQIYQDIVTHNKELDDIIIKLPKKKALAFHGMSSEEAHEQHYGPMENYKTAEGVEITVPYKGPVEGVINKILGGIRSACAYTGATSFKEFSKCCTFIKVNRQKEFLYGGIYEKV